MCAPIPQPCDAPYSWFWWSTGPFNNCSAAFSGWMGIMIIPSFTRVPPAFPSVSHIPFLCPVAEDLFPSQIAWRAVLINDHNSSPPCPSPLQESTAALLSKIVYLHIFVKCSAISFRPPLPRKIATAVCHQILNLVPGISNTNLWIQLWSFKDK